MSNTLSIETAQTIGFKRHLKQRLGSLVALASPSRTRRLFDAPVSHPESFRDKAIMAYLKRRAIALNQQQFFERLHAEFWSGDGGAVFSQNCDHRFEDVFLAKQQIDFEQLKRVWNEIRPDHIVEFGCCSGLVLNYLTQHLPNVKSATGIEINAQQVSRNQASNDFDPRVSFACADGADWLLEHGQAKTLFVSNGGVLEYFRRARLDQMLSHLTDRLEQTAFFAVEPVAQDHDWAQTNASIPFGDELSFSHNYQDLFESNGFEVVHLRHMKFDQWRMMAIIAVSRPTRQ